MGLAALLLLGHVAPVFYLSPSGLDSNAGLKARPVKTLERALAIARTRDHGEARILFRPGAYRIAKTVRLDARDSGIQLLGEPGARLSGGVDLTAWHPLRDLSILNRLQPEARSHVVQCDVSTLGDLGVLKRRGFGPPTQTAGLELFVNEKPMPLARYPNEGQWLQTGETKGANAFHIADPRPTTWRNLDGVWVFGYWNFDWAESYEAVASYDHPSGLLTIQDNPAFGISKQRRFYFQNVLEELDSPGEWYLDRAAKRLYFWPPAALKGLRVVASVLNGPMFEVDHAHRVSFQGLQMEAGRASAIEVRDSTHITVDRCHISDFGTWGVSFEGGSDSGIRHCEITQTGEDGVKLAAGDFRAQKPGNLFADDNHIWQYSRWCRTYHPAVLIAGYANRIAHNLIEDAPHQAILLSGNDHVLEYNDIRRVCTETGDAGAIYMGRNTTMRGNIIRYNRFRKIGPTVNSEGAYTGVMAIYLDDCWAGTTIFGNLIEGPGTGVMIGGGRDNTVANNVFIGTNPAIHFDNRGRGWAAKYFVPNGEWRFLETFREAHVTEPPYSVRYPELARTLESELAFAAGNKVIDNVCVGPWIHYQDGLTENDLEYHGLTQNDLDYHRNVLLKDATLSEALRSGGKGFQPIPMSKIGPRP